MADTVSGFDMRETIEWYARSGVGLPAFSQRSLGYPVENGELIELSGEELGGLFDLFPANARKRSILRGVVGKPPTWFRKDSTSAQPKPTTNKDEAMSPTAIIPAYTGYGKDEKGTLVADVHLYGIRENVTTSEVRRIICAESFIHEVGHTIAAPALYVGNHMLRLADGRTVKGQDLMEEFRDRSERHPPISHYASAYRRADDTFDRNDTGRLRTAISEELCETIAAYFLGFAYCGDDSRRKNPFADRPEIKDFVRDFLAAELVKE